MNWKFNLAQFSDFNTNKYVHRSTAMANGNYSKTPWKSKGVQAYSITEYYDSLKTYNSYYDIQE